MRSLRLRAATPKMFWLCCALLTVCSCDSWAAIARVQSDQNDAAAVNSTTISSNTLSVTAGNLLVVMTRQTNSTAHPTVTDTAGNTFTEIGCVDISNVGADQACMFYAKNITGHASDVITATWGTNQQYRVIITHEYSGADTAAPLDAAPTPNNSGGTATSSITSGSFSTGTAGEVIVAFAGTNSLSSTYVAGSESGGYSIVRTAGQQDAASEDVIVSSIQSSVTASMSVPSGTVKWGLIVASFKAAGWGAGGAACTATEEPSADTSVTCTLATQNAEAGNVLVVWAATDNVSTTDGQTTLHSISDSAGNSYTKACEFTNGQGTAAAGATVSLHYSKLATQLVSGSGTITLTTSSSVVDKAMRAQEFTIAPGSVVSLAGTCQTEAADNADAGNLTISGLTSKEYLFVRASATESNAATSITATTSYTRIGSDGCDNTTGGTENTDIGACGEFRILTATGDSSNPTLADTTNDSASVYLALNEAAPPPASTEQIIISDARTGIERGR